jgi:hypothetical protein
MMKIQAKAVARGEVDDLRRDPMTHTHSPLGASVAPRAIRSTHYLRGIAPPVFGTIVISTGAFGGFMAIAVASRARAIE